LHYLTRFLDDLHPTVRVLVAIQQPEDLDAAMTMALLYEELAGDTASVNVHPASAPTVRRGQFSPSHPFSSPPPQLTPLPLPPPQPPARWVSKAVEEKWQAEANKYGSDDRWSSLRTYRRSKGLCYLCGEKWGKEHVCNKSIQHVVQEMLDCFQMQDAEVSEETATVCSCCQFYILCC